jgi:hypothetical protein
MKNKECKNLIYLQLLLEEVVSIFSVENEIYKKLDKYDKEYLKYVEAQIFVCAIIIEKIKSNVCKRKNY